MKINYNGNYYALSSFQWEDIPKFVVLTGKNGTGKSQLLQLLSDSVNKPTIPGTVPAQFEDFNIDAERALLIDEWRADEPVSVGEAELDQLLQQYLNEYQNYLRGQLQVYGKKKILFEVLKSVDNLKDPDRIQIADLKANLPINFYIDEEFLFNARISHIFRDYQQKLVIRTYEISNEGAKARTDALKKFEAEEGRRPWDLFNDFMKVAGLDLSVRPPEKLDKYSASLFDLHNNQISWTKLSSGEKVLIRLACWLLYQKKVRDAFPKLLLLDEPDAYLHPSMVQNLLDVILKKLIEELDMYVILTSHSPTMVALAPEESLYELKKPTQIKKISKKDGLSLLTEGLILVTDPVKYVFVEDANDVKFYEAIYNRAVHINVLNRVPPLKFISAGSNHETKRPGGVEEVKKIVTKFSGTGIEENIHGIIDMDSGNNSAKRIRVLGRYCIENYLYDPIIIFSTYLERGRHKELVPDSFLAAGERDKLRDFSESDLQDIIDRVTDRIESGSQEFSKYDKKPIKQTILLGKKPRILKYHRWIIEKSGKDIYGKVYINSSKGIFDQNVLTRDRAYEQFVNLGLVPEEVVSIFKTIQK